jgi:hypothetical protein
MVVEFLPHEAHAHVVAEQAGNRRVQGVPLGSAAEPLSKRILIIIKLVKLVNKNPLPRGSITFDDRTAQL